MNKEKIARLIFYCFVALGIENYSNGQNPNIEFDHYSTIDGLSNIFIYTIFQDSKGFIWFGTGGGLNRFDGVAFKSYIYKTDDTNSISDNIIYALTEDSQGNLWVMTNRNLNLYDRKKDIFKSKNFRVKNINYDDLSCTSGFIDSKGYLWTGTFGAIYRFKLYNNPQINNSRIEAERYILDEDDIGNSNKSVVYAFVEDKNNKIWVASFSKNLFWFDEKLKKFITYPINHPDAKNFSNKQKNLIKDRDGDFIIAIDMNGLLVWHRKENKFDFYKPNKSESGPNDNILFGMAEDNNGLIWISARDKGGVNIFNKKTGKFKYCLHDESNFHSLSSDKTSCVYQDKNGSMWVATNTVLDKYCPTKIKFKRYYFNPKNPDGLNFNNVLCFAESKDGIIWIGTDGGGLNRLDRKTGKFSHFTNDPANIHSLSSNSIISICEDHEGILWMGTFNGGLSRMKDNNFFAYYPDTLNPNSLAYRHVWYVLEDSKNNLWVGTLNSGLDLFDRKTNKFYHYTAKGGDTASLNNNGIIELYEDSKQNLYVSTYTGVSIIDLKKYDFTKMPPDIKFKNLIHKGNTNSISSNVVRCVREDKNGNIWFEMLATGIDKLDIKTGKFSNYSTKDGLPGNTVNSILIDDQNNLWLATNKGLAKFNPETNKIHVFDKQDGLQNTNFQGWALKTRDGEMFFGGPDGFNSFNPDRINYNNNLSPVVITGLRIFNKPVKVNEKINNKIILTNDISETPELVLTYKENFFTFEFAALDYTSPEKNKYAYMMVGFDKDWIQCGNKHEANYTNLDPGKYTFRVKASNNDDVWNEKGTSIEIDILPPWWRTWWFELILIISLIILLAYILFIVIDKIKRLANQTILNEQNQLKTLINNIPDNIFIKDKKSRFLVINNATIKFMGGKKEKEFLNKTDYDFYSKDVADKFFKQESEIITTCISVINEESKRNVDGKELILSTTKCPIINIKGETIGLVGIIRDITSQKMAELELIKKSDELKVFNTVLTETNTILEERQQQIEEQSEELKVSNEKLSERQIKIEEQANELLSHSENLKEINDLLIEKQQLIMEQSEELKQTNQQLSVLNATKDRFFSIIAHDLRNPFNVVSGFSEILLRNFDKLSTEKIRRFHEMIYASSTSGNILLENLLQWSRSQTGNISFEPIKLNLLAITEETLRLLESDAERKSISFQQLIDQTITVSADENMLKTILRNLISNAIKFTQENGIITLNAIAKHQELTISISDTGVGISEENIKKLFRIDTTVTTKGTAKESGTGLGLLLCREFVEKHNGKIWVESEEGKGSEFKFTLPLT